MVLCVFYGEWVWLGWGNIDVGDCGGRKVGDGCEEGFFDRGKEDGGGWWGGD